MPDPIRNFFDRDVQTDGPRVIFTFGNHGEAIGALNAARAVIDRNMATALHDAANTLLTGSFLLPDEALHILRRGYFEKGLARVIEILARERTSIPRERADDELVQKMHKSAAAAPAREGARKGAAQLLHDMLHMENGAHEGLSREDVHKLWDAAKEEQGFAAVEAFLSAVIGKPRT